MDVLSLITDNSITFIVMYIGVYQAFQISKYIHDRKDVTIKETMKFVDSILNDIQSQSLRNCKELGISHCEIGPYSIALQCACFVGLRNQTEAFLHSNGYYEYYTKIAERNNETQNRKALKRLLYTRGEQLRNVAIPYIEAVVSPDSVLANQHEERFSTLKAIEMFEAITIRHYQEILNEEKAINDFIKAHVPLKIYKLIPKYKHKSRKDL